MQDQVYVEQSQAAVHEDHLIDERGAELVGEFAEEDDVDEREESGAYLDKKYLRSSSISAKIFLC